MGCVVSEDLSTACVHTLLMPWLVMLSLRCCFVGQTPIYDQLRDEWMNADVPPSPPDLPCLDDSGRHSLGADAPSATAGVVGAAGSGREDVAPHHRGIWTHPAAPLASEERGIGGVGDRQATLLPEVHARTVPRHARGSTPVPVADDHLAASAAAAEGRAFGPKVLRAARLVEHTDPSLRQ